MPDMAQDYDLGPIQLSDIAKRQEISVKYLEQIIIPLKKAHFIEIVRGPKGGYLLARSPAKITLAEIVAVLEQSGSLVECTEHAEIRWCYPGPENGFPASHSRFFPGSWPPHKNH